MEAEIIIANNIGLTSITNIGYALSIKGLPGVSLIWNGTGVTNRTMLATTDSLVIESLTLDGGGRDVTLVQVNGGSFTMNEGTVLKNTSGVSAQSAVIISDNGTFVMNSGLITGIDSTDAVFSSTGTITMNNDAAISDNMAAGITLSRSTLTMTGHSHISNNTGKQTGGAGVIINSNIIMGVNPGDAPYVTGNRTDYTSGAWYMTNGSRLTMRYGSAISDNFAAGVGGGIRIQQSTISMDDNTAIRNNRSNSDGGGVYAQNGAILQIQGNAAVHDNIGVNGGGIYLNASSAFIGINNSSPAIYNNNATGNGGGIYVSATSTLDITGSSSITDNSAPNGNGGGIFSEDTTAYQNLTTGSGTMFHGNSAIRAYVPPADAGFLYPNIKFAGTSIAGHPLNNYDINYTGGELLTYHVEYNANGGTGSYRGPDVTPGSTDRVLSPAMTGISRPGYTFSSWNTEPDGSGTAYAPGALITVNANITLYAQWVPYELYTVTYHANGGCGSHVDTGISSGTQYTVLSPEQAGISRPCYTFIGWNTQPNGSGTAYAPGSSITITGSVILFAQWTADKPAPCCRPECKPGWGPFRSSWCRPR